MIVDSSVLIDWINDRPSVQVGYLAQNMADPKILIGDLVMVEVLQGTRSEWHFTAVERALRAFRPIRIADQRIAVEAARNYRRLRALGITPRKTIDTLIATRCIVDDLPLLFSDRDFQPFVDHLGLRDAMNQPA